MTEHEYSQGACQDGAAILKDGQPMTIEEILAELRGNQQGILDGSDHIADARKMVQGAVALMGDVTDEDGTTYHKALVVQFSTVEDFRAAMKAGQCRAVRHRLDRLEKAFGGELVTRPGAGRDSRTTLTDMGKKVLSQVTPILVQWDEALLEWGEV